MTRGSTPRPGEHVAVPWGLDTIEAEVLETYQSGRGVHLVLRMPVHGPAGEALDYMTFTLPLSMIEGTST